MKKKYLDHIISTLKIVRLQRRWTALVLALSILVGSLVYVNFAQPVITMTTICGREEHTHSASCFASVLCCSNAEEGHEHGADCYIQELICGKPEHVHTDKCYPSPELTPTPEPAPAETQAETPTANEGEGLSEDVSGESAAPVDESSEGGAGTTSAPETTSVSTPAAVPVYADIRSLSADKTLVPAGKTATVRFEAAGAELRYTLTTASETVASGELAAGSDSWNCTPARAGEYTFTLIAVGSDGESVQKTCAFTAVEASAPELSVERISHSVFAGEEASFAVSVKGGAAPLTYAVTATQGGEVIWETETDSLDKTVKVRAWNPGKVSVLSLQVTATDALGQTASANADVPCALKTEETRATWEKTMKAATEALTGEWGKDVLAIARTQDGYKESRENFIVDKDGQAQGWTRYGAWSGNAYAEWSTRFAAFCLEYAQVEKKDFPHNYDAEAWRTALAGKGLYASTKDAAAQAGDLVFLDLDEDKDSRTDGKADHVGVVTAANEKTVKALVGDVKNAVSAQEYKLSDERMLGFGLVNAAWEKAQAAKEAPAPTVELTTGPMVETTMEPTLDSEAEPASEEADEDNHAEESSGEEDLADKSEDSSDDTEEDSEETDETSDETEATDETEEPADTGLLIGWQSISMDGADYALYVYTDEMAGIPGTARFVASTVSEGDADYERYAADALAAAAAYGGSSVDDLRLLGLFDLTIYDGDAVVRPDGPVQVYVDFGGALSAGAAVYAIHFPGTGAQPEPTSAPEMTPKKLMKKAAVTKASAAETIVAENVGNGIVGFTANGFSVYAVVGDRTSGGNARATVNFYGKDTSEPIATVYVKNSDTLTELEQIVFDPGCGTLDNSKKELFDGWVISTVNTTDGSSYTIDTEGKTIEDVRDYLNELDIKEGDVVNVYAKIVRTITVSYQGEDANTILGTVTLKVLGSDDPSNADNIAEYDLNMNYTPETATQAFMGWMVVNGAANILSATYNGEDVSQPYLNGTTLTVNGDVTLSVNAPYGHWVVFDENGKGATYNAPKFIKDGEITQEPPQEMVRLGYTFGGWYTDKDCTDGNEFTFGGELTDNITLYAKWTPAATANYTVIVWKERMTDTYAENGGTGEGKDKNYDFAESYTLVGIVGSIANAVSNGTSSVVDGDVAGTRYNNARIQGMTSDNANVDTTVSYTGYHCAGYDTEVEITPEGNSVINVYYDRNTVTYTFYTYGAASTVGAWWLCTEDGDHIIQSGSSATSNTRIATRNGNNYSQYTGRVAYDDGRTYYYSTTGACGGTNMREAHWEYVTNSGSQWNVYQQSTGLYGEPLDWPTDTSIWWYEGHNNTSGTGTRMTYKDAFLPLDTDMTVEYWGNKASASGTIHFWTQNVDDVTEYTDQVQVATGNANFSINDKFTGFYAYQYRTDNGTWHNVGNLNESTGIYGSPVSYNSRLDIRYNRIKAAITFMDGSYFDGNGNRLEETPQAEEFSTTKEYYYEADVSSYNKGGSDYYTPPAKSGYTFAGWYADDACTVAYDFATMPVTGITVYAKWIQNQYRIFLHPNVPESDTTLDWGSEDQDMTFRVSSGGKVSVPTGTRTGYKLIGWYLDEACTEVFDADRYILNDTSVTTPYDKTVDMTDVMNKYGNIVGTGSNSDLNGYNGGERFWITRKLDLYAKWRAELVGAEGIGVRYDANGGTNAPSDTNLYLDNTDTVAQGAATPTDDTQQFLYWVMQRWDEEAGEYIDVEGEDNKIYPGESFTVLKSNAYIEELEGSTEEEPKYRYTVQLRAQYGPKDEPTPTHLTWYANGGAAIDGTESYTDPDLQINEAVYIRSADTFTRPGYRFIGWAKVGATAEDYTLSVKELSESDLFLKYENDKFFAQVTEGSDDWTEVEEVAADERSPYQDLYAVWEKKTYTVTVTKTVTNGFDSDENIPFTFTPSFVGLDAEAYTAEFQIVGNAAGVDLEEEGETRHYDHTKVFVEVPYDTVFTIMERGESDFDVSASYTITGADDEAENVEAHVIANGGPITVKGNVELTVVNTRKQRTLRVMKTDANKKTPLGGAVFTVNVNGTDYTLTSDDEDGYLKNDVFPEGIITIPYGTYALEETEAPAGYLNLETPVSILVNGEGVSAMNLTVEEPSGEADYYTVIIPNNPGVTLPSTGGIGTRQVHLLGLGLAAAAAVLLMAQRRRRHAR